jgi:hypothetical protein
MFNERDIAQIEARGISVERVEQQIENFRNGFPSLPIVRAAAGGDGVKQLSCDEVKSAEAYYTERASSLRTLKFVPASGAATRMFKELFEYVNEDKRTPGIDKLIVNLEKFAFFPELAKYLKPQIEDKDVVRNIPHTFDLPGGVYNFGAENHINSFETAVEYAKIQGIDPETVAIPDTERFPNHIRNLSISMRKAKEASGGRIHFMNTIEGLYTFISQSTIKVPARP